MNPLALVDGILNRITMYRLVLYYLSALVVAAGVLGLVGLLAINAANLAFSTAVILGVCWLANTLFARGFGAATNVESVWITGLILVLLISPVTPTNYAGVAFLIFASAWAMGSKYILALGKRHIFNPAALGIALSALLIGQFATWWVGASVLLPLVLLGGLLVVRKLKRFDLVLSFAVVALMTTVLTSGGSSVATVIRETLLGSSLFFLGLVMLTEPLTMPPGRWPRIAYGALVGLLFAPNIHIGGFYLTPELALLAGNLFAYTVSPKGRAVLTLVGRRAIGTDTYEFQFRPDKPIQFRPGQYLEWTLPHASPDSRGNRRFFTIASAPEESTINLGVKFYEPPSSFKRALAQMQRGDLLSAAHLSGDFVLPKDTKEKLVFIAGGIGITPFRSMVAHLRTTHDTRDIVLVYANREGEHVAYKDFFDDAARELGIKTLYTAGTSVDGAFLRREIPDYASRTFYISGPRGMVEAFKTILRSLSVSRFRIKTDYFPGFA